MSTDARFPCEHWRYERHRVRVPDDDSYWCAGGSPVEGETITWCAEHDSKGITRGVIRLPVMCEWAWLHRLDAQEGCRMVERLLVSE